MTHDSLEMTKHQLRRSKLWIKTAELGRDGSKKEGDNYIIGDWEFSPNGISW